MFGPLPIETKEWMQEATKYLAHGTHSATNSQSKPEQAEVTEGSGRLVRRKFPLEHNGFHYHAGMKLPKTGKDNSGQLRTVKDS